MDPVTLRVASGALRAACEEMGAVLIRASHSANIKERRDASCALFDPDGELVMGQSIWQGIGVNSRSQGGHSGVLMKSSGRVIAS